MIMAIKIASLVKFYTILLLIEKPKHGYELMKRLEKQIGQKISPSQVYPFLRLLEKEGLIKVREMGSRDKIVYSLTKKGLLFAKRVVSRSGELLYLTLKPQIASCTHCGCKVVGGHKEKIGGKKLTFCCRHCAKAFRK